METKTKVAIAAGTALAIGVGLIFAAEAFAGDLGKPGGDCCADLEERVAELEATTVTKSNRKVALRVYGQVNYGILHYDLKGAPGGNDWTFFTPVEEQSRFGFVGEGKFASGWKAGFVMELGIGGNDPVGLDTGPALLTFLAPKDGTNEFQIGSDGISTRHAFAYVDTPAGKIAIGHTSSSTDGVIEANTAKNGWLASRPLSLDPLTFGGAAKGLNLPFDGGRTDVIKYVSPTWNGFTASASWGDAEMWDAALAYRGEFSGFKFAGSIGYRDERDVELLNVLAILPPLITLDLSGDITSYAGSASVMHATSGVFVTGFYSKLEYDLTGTIGIALGPLFGISGSFSAGELELTGWGGQAGIEKKFFDLGATTIAADYQRIEIQGADFEPTIYGLSVVQSIDPAAADFYVNWKRVDLDLGDDDSFDVFSSGMRIKF